MSEVVCTSLLCPLGEGLRAVWYTVFVRALLGILVWMADLGLVYAARALSQMANIAWVSAVHERGCLGCLEYLRGGTGCRQYEGYWSY